MTKMMKRAAIAAAVVTIALPLASCASSSKSSTKSTNTTAGASAGATTTTAAKKSGYGLGDTAKTGDFQATVYAVKDPFPPANDFSTPKAGNHFVEVDVQIANAGKDQQSFSSLLGFHLIDGQNRSYDESIGAGVQPGPPEGQIGGGQAVRGFVVFEVPDGTTGLKLKVQGGLTASGAVFTLS